MAQSSDCALLCAALQRMVGMGNNPDRQQSPFFSHATGHLLHGALCEFSDCAARAQNSAQSLPQSLRPSGRHQSRQRPYQLAEAIAAHLEIAILIEGRTGR